MHRGSIATLTIICSLAFALLACDNSRHTQLTEPNATRIDAAAGAAPNERVARMIALALSDDAIRGAVHQAFQNSTVAESKLFLPTFLRGDGAPLLREMARRSGISTTDLLALVDQLPPLEMYMPVPAHRKGPGRGSVISPSRRG